jgi:fatty acid desaturase
MTDAVRTPITQALQDGAISRRELKALMQRSNLPAFRHLAIWIILLVVTGTGIALTMGTIWVVPAMFIHGVVLVHHFSLQHECCHYTVFRTRWLNDAVGWICGLIINVPHQHFRYEHCDHHTYTQLNGQDPELIPLPTTVWSYLKYISAIPYVFGQMRALILHASGRIDESEVHFLPKDVQPIVFLEARLMLGFYVALLIACIATGWTGPLWFWLVPYLMGEPVMRAIRMTEHVGRPNVDDLRENTRSNLVSKPFQFLCWNMNYHAEHHYASSVPFHALPRLHTKLDGYIFVEPRGYWGAHRDIVAQLLGKKPRSDAKQAL